MPSSPRLDIDRLHPPHLLDAAELDSLSASARVRLSADHDPPKPFAIQVDGTRERADLTWTEPEDVHHRTYPPKEATENGAVACAFVALHHVEGLVALARCSEGFHADYYMLPADAEHRDLERCILLEVSGVGSGGASEIVRRMNKKAKRLKGRTEQAGNPAMTAIVGFDSCIIQVRRET